MNSEDKIYNKIRNASHKGEKDFPGMDKVWNRVEEKLDNTIVVKKKNTWQKLAIAATVLLSFSIIYHFVSNDEIIKEQNSNNNTENPVIVSNDSVKKIIDEAKEIVVDNSNPKKPTNGVNPYYNSGVKPIESKFYSEDIAPDVLIDDTAKKMEFRFDTNLTLSEKEKGGITMELNKNLSTDNEVSLRNSALNFSSSNNSNAILAPNKKYDGYKSKSASPKMAEVQAQKSDDLIVIDGVVANQKELDKLNAADIDEVTGFPNPLYIINGVEYSEESLFGKNPASPYAPLNKQKITSFNSIKPVDATKIYGQKGEKGVVIITTKDGKPADK